MPTTTNNMGLKIPIAGETDYATSVSDTTTAVDAHDHTSSKGVQIPSGGLADSAVTIGKIADGALANSTAGRLKMADGYLSADDGGRAKMADGFVTQAKRAALGQRLSSSSGTFLGNTGGSAQDITNLSVSITTTGRPVVIALIHDGNTTAGNAGEISLSATGTTVSGQILILRDSTIVGNHKIAFGDGTSNSKQISEPGSAIKVIDVPSANTYTYKAQYLIPSSPATDIAVNYLKLIAYEL